MLDFAQELFSFWDSEQNGFVAIKDVLKDMMAIGLAPNCDLLTKMICIILRRPMSTILKETLTVKDFMKICGSSRLVSRILKVLNESVRFWLNQNEKKKEQQQASL